MGRPFRAATAAPLEPPIVHQEPMTEVALEGMGTLMVPKVRAFGFHFVHGRKTYYHVGEDAEGRRIFRRDG